MPRYFASRDPLDPAFAILPDEEMHHARSVMRMRPGEEMTLILEEALYASLYTGERRVPVGEKLPDPEADIRVTLFQGIPKADKMEWICQKATECGADAVVPVAFSRSVSRWDEKSAAKKTERLERIMREAAKQSGRARAPKIDPPVTVSEMAERCSGFDTVLVPWEEASETGPKAFFEGLSARPKKLAVVIGP
ncbi:MAG: 16S rRNA (uracil(1498)-N(3))-methyltransferase, partial [Clostridia bacterium]|nr:16S rRNA (uracil(1498)-N(3))-methyltransferase [Clostridia bacterium]